VTLHLVSSITWQEKRVGQQQFSVTITHFLVDIKTYRKLKGTKPFNQQFIISPKIMHQIHVKNTHTKKKKK